MKIREFIYQLPNKTKIIDYGDTIVAMFKGSQEDTERYNNYVDISYKQRVVHNGTEYELASQTKSRHQIDENDWLVVFMANKVETNYEDMEQIGSV